MGLNNLKVLFSDSPEKFEILKRGVE